MLSSADVGRCAQAAADGALENGDSGEEDLDYLDAMRLVQDLQQLSSDFARDATEDDHIFGKVSDTRRA